jgi:hypothetical protein
MPVARRVVRILILLGAVIAVPFAVASVAGNFVGHRVYLVNSTLCDVAVMEEHGGLIAKPGEKILIKSGLIDRTPSMMITANWDIWFSGLRFASDGTLALRGRDGAVVSVVIPSSWNEHAFFGTVLIYEVTRQGQLVVRQPASGSSAVSLQPSGLPVEHRSGSRSKECAVG